MVFIGGVEVGLFVWFIVIVFFGKLFKLCWLGEFKLFFLIFGFFILCIWLSCVEVIGVGVVDFVLDVEVFIVLRSMFFSLGLGEDLEELLDLEVEGCFFLCFNGDFFIIVRGVDLCELLE